MVKIICYSPDFRIGDRLIHSPNKRYITIEYDDCVTERGIIKQIQDVLDQQPQCDNCVNYKSDGYCCGYESHSCKIHGCIEFLEHPHHDKDGSKCEDYKRIGEEAR